MVGSTGAASFWIAAACCAEYREAALLNSWNIILASNGIDPGWTAPEVLKGATGPVVVKGATGPVVLESIVPRTPLPAGLDDDDELGLEVDVESRDALRDREEDDELLALRCRFVEDRRLFFALDRS